MERNITEKEKYQIVNFGAFEYSNEMCSIILGWDVDEIDELMSDKKSEFYKLYRSGFIKSQYVIDLKLFEQAQSGDIKSLEKLEQRKRLGIKRRN
jgi:hypothetical protein